MAQRWAIYIDQENNNGQPEPKPIQIFDREANAQKTIEAMKHVADSDTQFTYDRHGRSKQWRQNAID